MNPVSSMTTLYCDRCRSPIPVGAPEGACPRCLVDLAMHTETTMAWSKESVPPDLADLQSQFDDLEIERMLGQGGMGAVYLARQKRLDREVALKIMSPRWTHDPVFEERFLREARALARLSHPHIVSVYDMGHAGSYCFILMEYIDGASLRALIRDGQLSASEALRLVPQICDAIQYAHDQGVIHRDIKPENVLVDQNGQVKIADFGIAKLRGEPSEQVTLTAAGARMGTSGYMAPEQLLDTSRVDHRADIYSLGILFYEMLTGKLPTVDYTPPSKITEVDTRFDRVVERSLRNLPEERFQQAAELKRALEQISASKQVLTRMRWGCAILTLAVVVAGAYAFLAGRDTKPSAESLAQSAPASESRATTAEQIPPSRSPSFKSPSVGKPPLTSEEAKKLQADWAAHLATSVEKQDGAGIRLLLTPPGDFELTSGYSVRLTRPYYLARTEVTVGQFRAFIRETGYVTLAESSGRGGFVHATAGSQQLEQDPSYRWDHVRFSDDDSRPVAMLALVDMERFCQWLSEKEGVVYRLPSEAEWIWAARAGVETTSMQVEPDSLIHDCAWLLENSDHRSQAVASKRPNAWGFHDMFGNMCEMCLDSFENDFPHGQFENPVRSVSSDRRAGLGSSFADPYSAVRLNLNESLPFHSIGFRVLCEIPSHH
jgi:serine/threonine protein kinase